MTYAPKSLNDLMAYWKAQGGVNLGIVGDTAHQARQSYHNGQDAITKYGRTAANDYSIRTARDREPNLTNAAAACDLGRLDGTLTDLWKFSRWFAGECFDANPAYRDVREVIFWSTARDRVLGWSATAPGQWINDYGDLSHKTHTHISFYRDSESRPKTQLFAPYFPVEVDMPSFKTYATPKLVAIPTDGWIYVKSDLSTDPNNIKLNPGRDLPVSGVMADGTLIVGYRDTTPTEPIVSTYYVKGTPKDYPVPPPVQVPPDAVACKPFSDAAVKTAVAADRLKAYVAWKP